MAVFTFRMLQILGRGFSMLRQFTPELCEVLYERVSNLKKGRPLIEHVFLLLIHGIQGLKFFSIPFKV